MGCGACLGQKDVVQPESVLTPVSTILQNYINRYISYVIDDKQKIKNKSNNSDQIEQKKQKQFKHLKSRQHSVLTIKQCYIILQLLASTNGQLPEILTKSQNNIKPDSEYQAAYAAGSTPALLTTHQRIIWKCLLIIPPYIQPYTSIKYSQFSKNITAQQQIVQNSFYQISLDVNRTFPKNQSINRADLTLLLKNITNSICGIGYTQGMNFYAGFLLLSGFTVEQAYHIFMILFTGRQFFLCHNYSSTFKQVQTCNQLLSDSLSLKLSSHLQNQGISEQIYSLSWFLCSFLYTLEIDSCILIWDFMIKSGCCEYLGGGFLSIVNIAMLIMSKLQQRLLQASTPEALLTCLKSQNINKVITSKQIKQIIQQMKKRMARCTSNQQAAKKLYKIQQKRKGKETEQIFRKYLITNNELLQGDKQLKNALTTKQGYDSYLKQVLGITRGQNNANQQEHQKQDQIVHVGDPNKLYRKQFQNKHQ